MKDTATVKAVFEVASLVEDYPVNQFKVTVMVDKDILHIENGNQAESIEIVDLNGKVYGQKSSENIDLSAFVDGTYMLRLKYGGFVINKKIIKK